MTQQPPAPDYFADVDPTSVARGLVLRRLSRAPQTRFQIEQYLLKKEVPLEIITEVCDRFERARLIDDEEFAGMWVRSRRLIRGTGPSVLRRELRTRGVADYLIDAAVEERVGDDRDVAFKLATRRVNSLLHCDRETQLRRLSGFLIRRGHNPMIAFSVARDVIDQTPTDTYVGALAD